MNKLCYFCHKHSKFRGKLVGVYKSLSTAKLHKKSEIEPIPDFLLELKRELYILNRESTLTCIT